MKAVLGWLQNHKEWDIKFGKQINKYFSSAQLYTCQATKDECLNGANIYH